MSHEQPDQFNPDESLEQQWLNQDAEMGGYYHLIVQVLTGVIVFVVRNILPLEVTATCAIGVYVIILVLEGRSVIRRLGNGRPDIKDLRLIIGGFFAYILTVGWAVICPDNILVYAIPVAVFTLILAALLFGIGHRNPGN